MPRRRHRRTTRNVSIASLLIVTAAGYLMITGDGTHGARSNPGSSNNGLTLASLSDLPAPSGGAESTGPMPTSQAAGAVEQSATGGQGLRLFELGKQNEAAGDLVNARSRYNEAVNAGLPEQPRREVLDRLFHLADEMVFSTRRVEGDPLTSSYVVKSGETLARIARQHHLPAAALARINQLKDINRIHAGQTLKVLHGPFHVVIHKASHDLYVYQQDVLVRYFKVGLGENGSTPTGEWVVQNKLINPTYYDPRGSGIVAADDPNNPLGERWIGLEGVKGEAVGQQRYGIHGTNEPDTIGQNKSLGCVRMYNQDVEWLYDLLVEQHSRVVIRD